MLYRNVIEYVFNMKDEVEAKQYDTTKSALLEAGTKFEEVVTADFATITIYAPRWKKI